MMSIVESYKANQGTLERPPSPLSRFNPVCGGSKVAIGIRCLPCITSQVDIPHDFVALGNIQSAINNRYYSVTYIQSCLEIKHPFAKHLN